MFRCLKSALIVIALLAFEPAQADTFVFKDAGIAIDTPEGWAVLNASVNADFLSDSNVTEEFKEMSRASSETQLLSMARENPPVGVSPGLHLNYWPGHIADIEIGLQNVVQTLRTDIPNFALVTEPTLSRLGALRAGYVSFLYEITTPEGQFAAVETFWLVPLGNNYLTISAGVSRDEGPAAVQAIDRAIRSLRRFP